jgi:hypothetical protein
MLTPGGKSGTATLGIGAAVIAIACCAGLPAIAALVSGVTLGAVLGFGLGAVALGVLAWTATAIVIRRRRDRRGERSQDR